MVPGSCDGSVGAKLDPTKPVVFLPFSLPQVQTKVHLRMVFLSLKQRPVGPGCETDFVVVTVNMLFYGNIAGDPIKKLPIVQT